jgi:hypothetical protein
LVGLDGHRQGRAGAQGLGHLVEDHPGGHAVVAQHLDAVADLQHHAFVGGQHRGGLGGLLAVAGIGAAAPDLLQPQVAAAAHAVGVVLDRVVLGVVAVIGLGRPEGLQVQDLGLHRAGLQALGGLGARLLGDRALGRGDEHRRAVGRAAIAELAAVVGGVDQLPVLVEQEAVVELGGIVGDAHRLVVARGLAGHVAIGRAIDVAAGVAALDLQHARNAAHVVLHAPEAAAGEHGGRGRGGLGRRQHVGGQQDGGETGDQDEQAADHRGNSGGLYL